MGVERTVGVVFASRSRLGSRCSEVAVIGAGGVELLYAERGRGGWGGWGLGGEVGSEVGGVLVNLG